MTIFKNTFDCYSPGFFFFYFWPIMEQDLKKLTQLELESDESAHIENSSRRVI